MGTHATVAALRRVDWALLGEQKAVLVGLIRRPSVTLTETEYDALNGVVRLLEHVQDAAAAVFGDTAVYGPDDDNTQENNHVQ